MFNDNNFIRKLFAHESVCNVHPLVSLQEKSRPFNYITSEKSIQTDSKSIRAVIRTSQEPVERLTI